MKNVRNRIKVKFIEKHENRKINKKHPKLTFNGIHKFYTNYDSYTFKQNEAIYMGFTALEMSNLLMHETY